jgi:hypothetical protein
MSTNDELDKYKLIVPKWWQWRKRLQWSRKPKITDSSIASIIRKMPKPDKER